MEYAFEYHNSQRLVDVCAADRRVRRASRMDSMMVPNPRIWRPSPSPMAAAVLQQGMKPAPYHGYYLPYSDSHKAPTPWEAKWTM